MESVTLGQIQTILTFVATFITSGGIILAFALKIGKKILDNSLEPFNKKIEELDKGRKEQHNETLALIDTLKEELNKNSLNTMKNTICNENIPLSERVSVGKEYIENGGNGAVKIYVHKLEEEYEKQLNAIN